MEKENNLINTIKKIIIGMLAGIVSGLFSTGGGMILVPAFIHLLELEDTKARGTSVFCILPMVVTSSFFYYKGNYINWKLALLCAIGGAIGGYMGAKLLKKLPEKILKMAFTIFLIYVSFKMITT
ncbi:MAG: sulfite exporter TauE/SafE family protein [Clostridia bacterium]|nr:sulfite exporter TauE/SafE family protein [Clostridia bacterium]